MKNIISPIVETINEDIVKESFLKYLNDYDNENNKTEPVNKKSDHLRKPEQVRFAFKELTKYYSETFTNEVYRITKEIEIHQKNDEDTFADFLNVNYKELISWFNAKELQKPANLKFDKSDIDSKYINYGMRLVRYHLQNEFIAPIINFIDNNYISFLVILSIFPAPIEKLISEISNNNLVLKVLKTDKPTTTKFHAVYSEVNKCSYYLSYNSFVDLSSYYDHLNSVVNEFETYINETVQLFQDTVEKISLYNKIKLGIKFALLSFSKVDSSNTTVTEYLPKNARNDTYAIFHQFINESFHESQEVKFNPDLIDFQDLQYNITKKALVFIKTKINVLKGSQELIDKESKPIYGVPPVNLFHNKIKTNLTVPQIACLFKYFSEENDILDMKNKTDLYRNIAACFTSKRKEEFAAGTVGKNFNQPDEQSLEYWKEKCTHFLQFIKKFRENNGG